MSKFIGLKQASIETGIAEYSLRLWCKQKKIRFNVAGNTKYILRLDWLDEDLQKMALENIKAADDNVVSYGSLRKIGI